MLSEKAKGKQRVVELSDAPDDAAQSRTLTKPLVIRFTEGIQDLSLEVEQPDAVRDVKRKVRPCTSYGVVAHDFLDSRG